MTARDEILGRIRAIAKAPAAEPHAPAYNLRWDAPRDQITARFAERLADYGVTVLRARSDNDIRPTAEHQLAQRGIATLVIPPDLPATWRPKTPSPSRTMH